MRMKGRFFGGLLLGLTAVLGAAPARGGLRSDGLPSGNVIAGDEMNWGGGFSSDGVSYAVAGSIGLARVGRSPSLRTAPCGSSPRWGPTRRPGRRR